MKLSDIGAFLEAAGLIGGATGWTFFENYSPATPDQAVVARDTGGAPGEATSAIDYPTFQLMVRSGKLRSDLARAKMIECYNALHEGDIPDSTTSPPRQLVYCFGVQSSPLYIGTDENERPEFVINFRAMAHR